MEDFVHWHSPRDLIIEENGNYHLSDRMSKEDNIWIKIWNETKPIPSFEQKLLFDPNIESEKVINFLENMKPSDVLYDIFLTCLSTILYIYENCSNECCQIESIKLKISQLKNEIIV